MSLTRRPAPVEVPSLSSGLPGFDSIWSTHGFSHAPEAPPPLSSASTSSWMLLDQPRLPPSLLQVCEDSFRAPLAPWLLRPVLLLLVEGKEWVCPPVLQAGLSSLAILALGPQYGICLPNLHMLQGAWPDSCCDRCLRQYFVPFRMLYLQQSMIWIGTGVHQHGSLHPHGSVHVAALICVLGRNSSAEPLKTFTSVTR